VTKNVLPLIIAVSLSLFFASSAFCLTEIPKIIKPITSFSVTPTVGYLTAPASDVKSSPLYGLRLSYDYIGVSIVDSIGVEATGNYFSTTTKSSGKKVDGMLLRADTIYSIGPRNKWVPFFSLGLGGRMLKEDSGNQSTFLVNYGVGLKYYLANYLALRVDARELFFYQNVATKNSFEITAGLTYFFGKERIKKAVAPVKQAPAPLPKAVPDIDFDSLNAPPPDPLAQWTTMEKLGAVGSAIPGITAAPLEYESPVLPPPFLLQKGSTIESTPGAAAPAAKDAPQSRLASPPASAPPAAALPVPAAPAPGRSSRPPASERAPVAREQVRFTVEFDFARAELKPQYDETLKKAAVMIRSSANTAVRIEGHTDRVGTDQFNQSLSLERARSVKERLQKLGVEAGKITITGFGIKRPIADNSTAAGRQKNRRAVTIITIVAYQ
jgi:OmpA-OmpF porin, OOP family